MLSLKASDAYDVVRPLHLYSQLLGVTSFSLRRVDGTFVAAYTWLNVLSLVFSTFGSLCFAVSFQFSFIDLWASGEFTSHQVFQRSIVCITFGFAICAVATNFWIFFAMNHFAIIFNLLSMIDEELERLTVKVNIKKHKIFCITFIALVQALATFDACLMEMIAQHTNRTKVKNVYKTDKVLLWSAWFSLQMTILSIFQFMFMMWTVKLRYEKINSLLEKEFLIKDDTPHGDDKLTTLAELHDLLVDVSERVNRCYGMPVSSVNKQILFNKSSEPTFIRTSR